MSLVFSLRAFIRGPLPPSIYGRSISSTHRLFDEQKRNEQKRGPKGPLTNFDIKHRRVRLVDPETRLLTEPRTLRSIMESIDQRMEFVQLVRAEPEPVVKVMNKRDVYERSKSQKPKSTKSLTKEVQMTWETAAGDLAHKLGKVRDALEEGSRVDVVFTTKKGRSPPSRPEMLVRVDEIVAQHADISTVRSPVDFQQGTAIIFLQGKGTNCSPQTTPNPGKSGTPKESKYRLRAARQREMLATSK